MTTPWITTGAEVAIVNRDRDRVEFRTVDRLTATQIVLDNGAKYRRDNLRPVGEPSGRKLEQPADPFVVAAVARQAIKSFATDALNAERATSARASAGDVLTMLDDLAAKLSAARDSITRLDAQ